MKSTLTFDRTVIKRSRIERSEINLQDSNVLEQAPSNLLKREDAYKLHDISQRPLLIHPARNIVDHFLVSRHTSRANIFRSKVYLNV